MKAERCSSTYSILLTEDQGESRKRIANLKGDLPIKVARNNPCYNVFYEESYDLFYLVFSLDEENDTTYVHDKILEQVADYFSKDL